MACNHSGLQEKRMLKWHSVAPVRADFNSITVIGCRSVSSHICCTRAREHWQYVGDKFSSEGNPFTREQKHRIGRVNSPGQYACTAPPASRHNLVPVIGACSSAARKASSDENFARRFLNASMARWLTFEQFRPQAPKISARCDSGTATSKRSMAPFTHSANLILMVLGLSLSAPAITVFATASPAMVRNSPRVP